eukprot:SAG22_NODE_277_length_13166_cov_134.125277_4_plen_206_part_00
MRRGSYGPLGAPWLLSPGWSLIFGVRPSGLWLAEELAASVVRGEQLQAALAAVALKLLEQSVEVDEERAEVQAVMASLGSEVFGSFESGGGIGGIGGIIGGTGGDGGDGGTGLEMAEAAEEAGGGGGIGGGDALRSLYAELEGARTGMDGLSAALDTLPYHGGGTASASGGAAAGRGAGQDGAGASAGGGRQSSRSMFEMTEHMG